jgi:acyl-CoA thioesterase-2
VTRNGGVDAWAVAETLADILDVEPLDRDLFRGVNSLDARDRRSLYGGQVAAQALRAAAETVPGDRFPHSLHGYFLRPGRADRPVILAVARDRDGRSFSARHVNAIQDGEVIFSMLASFHVDEHSGTFEVTPRSDAPPPDSLAVRHGISGLVELREVTPTSMEGDRPSVTDQLWVRARHALRDDRIVQACALAYVSDFGSGFGQVDQPDLPPGGPSIDHAIWFHRPIRVDDWVLIELHPVKAGSARGVYLGTMRDREGGLAAMLTQEILLRPPG